MTAGEDGALAPPAVPQIHVLACGDCFERACAFVDTMSLLSALWGVPLDSRVTLRVSLPRRYGGGTGAGLQLVLPICYFCWQGGEGPPSLEECLDPA